MTSTTPDYAQFAEEFDPMAQAAIARLKRKNPTLEFTFLGGSHPFLAEGTWQGYAFAFTFEDAMARLYVGATPEDATYAAGRFLWISERQYGEAYKGDLTFPEFVNLFRSMAKGLERATFRYFFSGPNRGPRFCSAYGNSPEEAYARLIAAHPTITFYPEPTVTDNRVFPEVTPAFILK